MPVFINIKKSDVNKLRIGLIRKRMANKYSIPKLAEALNYNYTSFKRPFYPPYYAENSRLIEMETFLGITRDQIEAILKDNYGEDISCKALTDELDIEWPENHSTTY